MQAAKRGYMVVVQDFERRQSEVRRAFDLKVANGHPLDWPSRPRRLKPGDLGTAFCQKSGQDIAGRRRVAGRVIGQYRRGRVDAASSQPRRISQSDYKCTRLRCTAQSKENAPPKRR
jgi:hypothetical protein